jgi:hypothetical protein
MYHKQVTNSYSNGRIATKMAQTQRPEFDKSPERYPNPQLYIMRAMLVTAGLICGLWVVGSRNLLYWVGEMSEWFQGDNGPIVTHVIFETLKLIARIVFGGYGCYKLLKELLGVD